MKPMVTTNGVGAAGAAPDSMRLQVAVRTTSDSVGAALAAVSAGVAKAGVAARDLGVTDEHISTRGLTVWPQRSRDGEEISGYQATHSLELECRGLDTAGDLVAALAAELADDLQIDGVEPVVSDVSDLNRRARELAFADARAKAEQFAGHAGSSLGEVLEIQEEVDTVHPVVRRMAMAAESGPSFEAGSTSVSAKVRATWRLVSDR
jgi:uncharacterized protein YggE